jgi:universal stress protein E
MALRLDFPTRLDLNTLAEGHSSPSGIKLDKFSRILSVVDPAATEQPALRRAAWLAARTGATLELLTCYYNEYLTGDRIFDSRSLELARQDLLENCKRHLENLAKPLRNDGIDVSTAASWDHPVHEGIVRHAIATGAQIVFKDTHHHSALERAFLSNSDWSLIRACPVALWLVKPLDFPDKPVFVAAIDPMNEHDKPAALDDEILALCKVMEDMVGADVHVFHAYDPRIAVATATANAYIPVSLPLDEIEEEMRAQHEKRFRELTDFHGIDRDKTHLFSGLTHQELPALSRELNASVVVMGAVARNRLKRLFIGATAERTLEHLPCDLLIIKPDWFPQRMRAGQEVAACPDCGGHRRGNEAAGLALTKPAPSPR